MHRVVIEVHKCRLTYAAACNEAHVNLIIGDTTMRTRTVSSVRRELLFRNEAQDEEERFLTAVRDSQQTIEIQLRRDRFLLRSVRVASATLSLASLPIGHPHLFESLQLLNQEGNAVAHLDMEMLVVPNPGESIAPVAEAEAEAEKEGEIATVEPPPAPAVTLAQPPGSQQQSSEVASSQNTEQAKRTFRNRGIQTDSVPIWPADVGENVRQLPEQKMMLPDSVPVLTSSGLAEFPMAANSPQHELIGDVGLRMRKKNAIAWPTDEIEGLVLYCEMLQQEKRVAESRLAKYHLDKSLTRTRAIVQGSPHSSRSLAAAEEIKLKHNLNEQDAALVAQAFADI